MKITSTDRARDTLPAPDRSDDPVGRSASVAQTRWSISARPVPVVLAVPPAAHQDVAAMAVAHGCEVTCSLDVAHLDPPPAVPDGPFDLVVHAAAFDAVRDDAPGLLAGAREVRLVGDFEDPDSDGSVHIDDPWSATVPPIWAAVRRLVDVAVATTGLIVLSPVLLLTALVIRLETPGNPIFTQVRMGRHGRRFHLHKLRTMRIGCSDIEHRQYVAALIRGEAAAVDGVYKLARDPRITRVGRVLRRYSIDELPQLWDVLRGHMSLIGPRPDLPSTMLQCAGYVWARQQVRPGLTGLWQVNGRCAMPFPEMIALDLRYCAEVGPALDVEIMVRTPLAVLRGRGSA